MFALLFAVPTSSLAARPNVLFIVADDLRAELGCTGANHVISPNLDRLARKGRLFTRAYCQQAVCNPSRASFMTGLRPDTIGVWDLRTHFRKSFKESRPANSSKNPRNPLTRPSGTLAPIGGEGRGEGASRLMGRVSDLVTLPQLFRQNGYETRCIGKLFHNTGNMGDEPSWSQPPVMSTGTHSADTVTAHRKGMQKKGDIPVTEQFAVDDEAYQDGRIAKAAVATLGELKNKPFFLAVGFWRPHLPFVAPKKYWDLYDLRDLPMPVTWNAPIGCPPIALHDYREIKGYGAMPKDYPLTVEFTRHLRHGYYASVSYMDAQIGKVLRALDENGLRDNTIVVFLSDHGVHLGEHGLWAKTSCFEYDARVPLIISTPGMKQRGKATESLAELIDLYPTLADLTDLSAPKNLEGKSLVPILTDPMATVKEAAYTQHPRPAYYKGKPDAMGVSVRTKDFRYTEWRQFETKVIARELYDHRSDAIESRNIAANKRLASTVAGLERELNKEFPVRR